MNSTIGALRHPIAEPFCDWLDVTCAPDSAMTYDVLRFFDSFSCPLIFSSDDGIAVQVGSGVLRLDRKHRFHRVSASGAVLQFLRSNSALDDFLFCLSSGPMTITRIDLACDYRVDGPAALRRLERRYPDDLVSLTRKAMRVHRFYSARPGDGQQTGTWYIGHRSKAKVTARVYDKQAEVLSRSEDDIGPRTRVEITVRKGIGASLRDASNCSPLFYHFASPTLVDPPAECPSWEPFTGDSWPYTAPDRSVTLESFVHRLDSSAELDRLAALAAELGPVAEAMLIRKFQERLRAASRIRLQRSA